MLDVRVERGELLAGSAGVDHDARANRQPDRQLAQRGDHRVVGALADQSPGVGIVHGVLTIMG